jgi:hypothetical protein
MALIAKQISECWRGAACKDSSKRRPMTSPLFAGHTHNDPPGYFRT